MMLRLGDIRQAVSQQSQASRWSQTGLTGHMYYPSATPPLLTLLPGWEVKDHEPWGPYLGEGYIAHLKPEHWHFIHQYWFIHQVLWTWLMGVFPRGWTIGFLHCRARGLTWHVEKFTRITDVTLGALLTLTFGFSMVTHPYDLVCHRNPFYIGISTVKNQMFLGTHTLNTAKRIWVIASLK